jgi:hypothetical protein
MVVDNKRMHVSDCATKGASAFVFARTQKSPPPREFYYWSKVVPVGPSLLFWRSCGSIAVKRQLLSQGTRRSSPFHRTADATSFPLAISKDWVP